MKIFYFTATGNSLYVAKSISGELYSIPQMLKDRKSEFEDEAIGFVFPCYVFGLPKIVREFIQQSKFKADYFFAIMTYGGLAASGLKDIEKCGMKVGIEFNYTDEILMIDNYLPLHKIEDQLKKEDAKKIEEKLNQIVSSIQKRETNQIRKGMVSDVVSKLIHTLMARFFLGKDNKFMIQDNCNGCKVCEKVCPRKNIAMGRKPEFLHNCEACYACIHHCPQNAIHVKSEKSKTRFINQHVKLTEIMAANNQYNS